MLFSIVGDHENELGSCKYFVDIEVRASLFQPECRIKLFASSLPGVVFTTDLNNYLSGPVAYQTNLLNRLLLYVSLTTTSQARSQRVLYTYFIWVLRHHLSSPFGRGNYFCVVFISVREGEYNVNMN